MRELFRYIVVVALLLLGVVEASAQQMPERRWVRKGNRQYERERVTKSIESYQEALKHDPNCFEAKYDLASALYSEKRYDAAEKLLGSMVNDTTRTVLERGEVAYNLGNTQFQQQKFKEALASYRHAMRCNPDDEDAKANYAFTKLMMQQQQQQQQQQQENKENEQDKQEQKENQNQQNQQNQQGESDEQKGQPDEQKGEPDKPENSEQGKDEEREGGKPQEKGMTPEREALLQAVQAEEDKTQEKLKEGSAVVIRGNKNW